MGLEIKGFVRTSFIDWDGKVSAVIFLPFCNFRCLYCHNYPLVDTPEELETIPWHAIEDYLVANKDFIDGVVVSGGEPTIHPGLGSLIRKLRTLSFSVKLDTNGSNPKTIEELIKWDLVNFIAMDVKSPLDARYERIIGRPFELATIRRSKELIQASNIEHEFRTTLIPGFISRNEIREIARLIGPAGRLVLQQFVPKNTKDISMRRLAPYTKEEIEELKRIAARYVGMVEIRGV